MHLQHRCTSYNCSWSTAGYTLTVSWHCRSPLRHSPQPRGRAQSPSTSVPRCCGLHHGPPPHIGSRRARDRPLRRCRCDNPTTTNQATREILILLWDRLPPQCFSVPWARVPNDLNHLCARVTQNITLLSTLLTPFSTCTLRTQILFIVADDLGFGDLGYTGSSVGLTIHPLPLIVPRSAPPFLPAASSCYAANIRWRQH